MRRPLPQLTLDEELPDCLLPDMEETPEEELEKAEMIHVRCAPQPHIPHPLSLIHISEPTRPY